MKHKRLSTRSYNRDRLCRELMTLSMQRDNILLTSEKYQRELAEIRVELPVWMVLVDGESPDGKRRFTLKHVATGDVVDELEIPPATRMGRLSFK